MIETTTKGWRRVTPAEPCQVCGKPDWCTIGERYHCCMRIASDKPAKNGGWLHAIAGAERKALPPPVPVSEPKIPWHDILEGWFSRPTGLKPRNLASELGVTEKSLWLLEVVWAPEHTAWAWPMKDAYYNYLGIRLRDHSGKKWAVKGSHQGLFIPACPGQETAYVCEGPTDTAAALSMGLYAIGRPSCTGGEAEIIRLFRRLDVRRAVIISDNDGPGYAGAVKLSAMLRIPSVILVPPGKDIRAFYLAGGTAAMLQAQADSMVWNVPKNGQ